MKNQLNNISVQYRKFSKGQYIEDPDQFNEFLNFFEDQDRLSRVLLQGVGIVCGLKPKLIYKNRQLSSIELSQGVALTTDGDLLTLNKTNKVSEDLYVSDLKTVDLEYKSFTHFKAYDNFKIRYPSFYEGEEQIELWELATAQEAQTDFQPVVNLSNLNDKYLLLYLEDYEKDIKPCRGVDCDNHGILQIRNLKVLVTTARGIVHILGDDRLVTDPITGITKPGRKDRIQPHPLFTEGILGPVEPQRVILSRFISESGVENRYTAADLKKLYSDALAKYTFGQDVFEKIQTISQIMGFSVMYPYQIFKEKVEKCLALDAGFQYAYDVTKDLMATYSEIIKLLPKAFTKNFPNFASFPKHIMLGKLISDTQLDSTRHQFYNSPVLDDEKATQRLKELVNRFNQQVFNFNYLGNKKTIKITSSQKLNPLSNKSIPFYYEVTEGFLKSWNFDKTSNRSFADNVRYDLTFLIPGSGSQGPVDFSIDKSSFYNIEGHQGMDYQKAFEQIKEIRDKQQLGFDIMLLSLEELVGNKDLSKAYFNEYIEKNSGLEHKRGVEKGGTFIMVYDSIRNPMVIADFSIPYICCTPKTVVKLSLPADVICAEAAPIPFTVSPLNGVVKASVGSGVKFMNGQYFFDPKAVEEQYRDQEITFTVNGKPTDCSIKVISQPDINITVEEVFYPEVGSAVTAVKFKVSGTGFENFTYSWDFLDNGHFVTLNPDENGNVSYEFYKLDPSRIPTVKVQVTGNGCTDTVAVNLPLTKECPVISNIKYSVVDNGNGTQTFTFDWSLPSDLSGITGLNIYASEKPEDGWYYESGSYRPRRTITLSLGAKYYIRFGLVGSCRESENILNLPGLDDVGIIEDQNNHPPTAQIRWKDNLGIEDRLCRQSVCSFTIDVNATDPDGDIATVQIEKSTDDGATWNLFTDLTGTMFEDSINKAGKQLYRAIVTDRKGNKGISNILSYRKDNHPPAVSIRWSDNSGIEDRACTGSVCNYAVDVYASDPDGDIANIQIHKSTDNGVTWNVFLNNLQTNTFPDFVNQGVINWYKAVVIDAENNKTTSNILVYKNEYRPTIVIKNIDFSEQEGGVQCCEGIKPVVISELRDTKALVADGFFVIEGKAEGGESTKLVYSWLQISGPSDAILTFDFEKPVLKFANLAVGNYTFRFMAFDTNSDAFDFKDVTINVA
ncbi:PKD domain-containing protein [Chryseobacterium arthrosphaerae]|uniref:PKD domain-containing protein n=1 Tax=Chryseobacterium arthrosphaerae TaxID=651561 RepID=UPI001BAFAEEF|nr:hypothetical protein [Chryseobacterium arthrosphaerae]QUY53721.1 hypothetical protein I2F65_12575 [Chryseobacterium arthrosphaerae]